MDALYFFIYITALFAGSLLYFMLVQKPLFYFANRGGAPGPLVRAEVHGMRTDAIVATYLTAIPAILSFLALLIPGKWALIALICWYGVTSLAVGLLTVADTFLYPFWGYKIDASVFPYLRSLKGATASVSAGYIVRWILSWAFFSAVAFAFVALPAWLLYPYLEGEGGLWTKLLGALILILFLGGGFVIIRGLGVRPNNPSIAYFSTSQFLNHTALNPGYSIIYSLSTKDVYQTGFRDLSDAEVERECRRFFPKASGARRQLLRTDRPDILLVVWESAGSNFMKSLGGDGTACNFDRLTAEGLLFTRCYASSMRTDRALPAIIGGIPGQPTDSIIRHTRKLPGLSAFPRRLRDEGYFTTAVHGGDLSIMHKSDYYLSAGHDRLISQKDFLRSAPKGKWGVHDGEVFRWLYSDIMRLYESNTRWFTTLQTLSSHEPFEVPFGSIPDDKVRNSFAYTDHALGEFVERLRKTPVWDNLLMIVVADHGANKTGREVPTVEHAHIPLLLLGGALKEEYRGVRYEDVMGQTDIAATLLGQLGLDSQEFLFSRDVMSESYRNHAAFHSFINGFMVVDPEGHSVYDTLTYTLAEGEEGRLQTGKAILQRLYTYLSRAGS